MNPPTKTFAHDPDSRLDYGIRWDDWLEGDTITASEWTAVPTGLTLSNEAHDDTSTTVFAAGGTRGKRYRLTNHITTSDGREDDRSLILECKSR